MTFAKPASDAFWSVAAKRLLARFLLCLSAVVIAGCSGTGALEERDYFPGNSPYYSFGVAQSKENYANVSKAQIAKGLYADQRTWGRFGPGLAPGTVIMLQGYFPFSMRWELKDGRQFILENIDVRSIMKTFFKDSKNDITLPWQRDGRIKGEWDFYPSLVYEVKDDVVRLKWLMTILKTLPEDRIVRKGLLWDFEYEQHLVKEIKGIPVKGIDFSQDQEFRKNINRGAVNGN